MFYVLLKFAHDFSSQMTVVKLSTLYCHIPWFRYISWHIAYPVNSYVFQIFLIYWKSASIQIMAYGFVTRYVITRINRE